MSKKEVSLKAVSPGFGLIDFIIISFVVGIIAFVVISNIIAHNY